MSFNVELPPLLNSLAPLLLEEFHRSLERIGDRTLDRLRYSFQLEGIDASGATRRSLRRSPEVQRSGSRLLRMEVYPSGDRQRVAYFLERGRRPGKLPPLSAILDWMAEKGIGTELKSDTERRKVAFVIARSIADDGVRGHRVFARARDYAEVLARQEIADATQRALVRWRGGGGGTSTP